jgi:hypothetical protein
MTTQTEVTKRNHHRAVRFFWGFLIGATTVSLIGNVVHAMLPYIPRIAIQIGAAAAPPVALLAAVHGIALAVRAGASGKVYCWAVAAVAAIGLGAFAVSFLALRDLMRVIGYSSTTAWIFPAIIDTAVAISTLMLVALGENPARRARTVATSANTEMPARQRSAQSHTQSAKAQLTRLTPTGARTMTIQDEQALTSASVQPDTAQTMQNSAQTEATQEAEIAQLDADLASEMIASGVTTQPVETVIAVLGASRDGASINAAAKASGINYRTAQRIVVAAGEYRQRQLAVAS